MNKPETEAAALYKANSEKDLTGVSSIELAAMTKTQDRLYMAANNRADKLVIRSLSKQENQG